MNSTSPPTDESVLSIRQELSGVVRGLKAQLEKQIGDRVSLTAPSKLTLPNNLVVKTIEPRSQAESMADIRADLGDCRRCQLCYKRTNIVFGSGSEQARLMFIGEGPGADEDLQGLPFVGRAGILLTKMIAAISFSREQVYIANIVKCRPPQNRNPEPDEIATCLPFLKRQIAVIRPKVICALGKIAAQALSSTEMPISQMRGKFYAVDTFDGAQTPSFGTGKKAPLSVNPEQAPAFRPESRRVDNIPVMATYHPAYLLRNPAAKRPVWEDLQAIQKKLEN